MSANAIRRAAAFERTLLSSLLVALATATSASAEPNVLVLLLDDVGVDMVDAYGMADPTGSTPNIDALAADGLLFRNAWVAPVCSPTRAAILSGRYGFRTGVGRAGSIFPRGTTEVLLGEALPPIYTSTVIGKWHLTAYGPDKLDPTTTRGLNPIDFGFDTFRGTPENFAIQDDQPDGDDFFQWGKAYEAIGQPGVWEADRTVYATTDVIDDAAAFIQSDPEPWFAHVAFHAAHTPIQAPPDELHDRQIVKDLYEPGDFDDASDEMHNAMVEAADTEIARLLQSVDLTDTYVFILGDNGTVGSHVPPNAVQRGSKRDVYEGGVRVPFIALGPGIEPAETNALVHGVDLFATVLELAGVDPETVPAAGPLDGVSFASTLAVPTASPRDTVYTDGTFAFDPVAQRPENHDVAIRTHDYKLIRRACSGGSHVYEFYRLSDDPGEAVDLLPLPPGSPHEDAHRLLQAELFVLVGNPLCEGTSPTSCGAGPELAIVLPGLLLARARRRRATRASTAMPSSVPVTRVTPVG